MSARSVGAAATHWIGRVVGLGRRFRRHCGAAPSGPFVGAGDEELRPITFPVTGPITYFNDWGACRDGCRRSHQGNDLIGDRLQPLLAMRAGVVDRLLDHPTAGYGVVVRDDEGWEYHLYHVNNDTPGTDDGADTGAWRFAGGIRPGATVQAGQLIAWMGDSGNSEGSVPHAHVEIHRPDGTAINPYWSLRQAQRDVNCGIERVNADPATDPVWLQTGWHSARLPRGWQPLALTGGHPGSSAVAARMWIGRTGFTPVDGAALRAGDARFDEELDCTSPVRGLASTVPAELGPILAAIREMESGGDYTAEASASTASGAYQFVDSSWAGYGGYARASQAPPSVQDAKAAEHAAAILARNGGDVTTVPVSWYLGHVPVGAEWDAVPPYPGNHLTPREYQSRWLQTYTEMLGAPGGWVDPQRLWTPVEITMCRTVIVDVGAPGRPEFVLTLAQSFASETSGRAVPVIPDPCDPSRRPMRLPIDDRAPASHHRKRAISRPRASRRSVQSEGTGRKRSNSVTKTR
jgi:hypothetical protein